MPNTFDPYNPQHWANESIAILEEKLLAGQFFNRDFNKEVASFGQIVHTRKPGTFTAEPYEKGDTVTVQDASATDIEVKLDQMFDTTFTVYDVEETFSFKNLMETFLEPAVLAQAQMLDRKIFGKASQFLANGTGGLGLLSNTTAQQYLVETEKKFNDNKAPDEGRNMFLTSNGKAQVMMTDLFTSAERSSTGGETQRRAVIGERFGMATWMSLNLPSVRNATTATATTTTATSAAGDTVVNVTSASNVGVGRYFTVAGDMTPLRTTAVNTLAITVSRPLLRATSSGAVVQPYATGLVDLVAGYAAGWTKWIHVDGTGVPKLGQLVGFATAAGAILPGEYIIVAVKPVAGDYEIILDRPLETAMANDDVVCYGPNGDMNLFATRNAITIVNRPLALQGRISGNVRQGVAYSRNLAMRVTLGYSQDNKALKVSVDSLFGVKVVESALGGVMFG